MEEAAVRVRTLISAFRRNQSPLRNNLAPFLAPVRMLFVAEALKRPAQEARMQAR